MYVIFMAYVSSSSSVFKTTPQPFLRSISIQGAIVSPNAKRSHWYSDPIAVIHPEFPKSPFNTVGWRKKAIE